MLRGNSTLQTAVGSAIEIVDPTKRVQLFPIGTWQGRNGLGPYTIADRAHAEKIIAATAAAQGLVELMFDYDHQAVRAPAVAGKAVASGWIKQLHAQDDGIWADVEWTDAAAAAIAAREYRYTSPYFLHDKAGNVTRIINAGLTNTPNFNLAAVAASSLTGVQSAMDELLKAILQALGLPEDATQEQAMAKIGELTGASTALASATSVLGLTAGADSAAIASAITNIKAANDPAKFVPIEQLKHVNDRLAAIEGDKHEAAVASAIAAGKLAPSLKTWAMDPANRAAFASFIETAPVILAPGSSGGGKVDPKSDILTDDERAIASSLGLSTDQYLQARKDGE